MPLPHEKISSSLGILSRSLQKSHPLKIHLINHAHSSHSRLHACGWLHHQSLLQNIFKSFQYRHQKIIRTDRICCQGRCHYRFIHGRSFSRAGLDPSSHSWSSGGNRSWWHSGVERLQIGIEYDLLLSILNGHLILKVKHQK